jgi:hypothetical protein
MVGQNLGPGSRASQQTVIWATGASAVKTIFAAVIFAFLCSSYRF